LLRSQEHHQEKIDSVGQVADGIKPLVRLLLGNVEDEKRQRRSEDTNHVLNRSTDVCVDDFLLVTIETKHLCDCHENQASELVACLALCDRMLRELGLASPTRPFDFAKRESNGFLATTKACNQSYVVCYENAAGNPKLQAFRPGFRSDHKAKYILRAKRTQLLSHWFVMTYVQAFTYQAQHRDNSANAQNCDHPPPSSDPSSLSSDVSTLPSSCFR
jgi:hypothetical protein